MGELSHTDGRPARCTSAPSSSLVLKAMALPDYQPLLEDAVAKEKGSTTRGARWVGAGWLPLLHMQHAAWTCRLLTICSYPVVNARAHVF